VQTSKYQGLFSMVFRDNTFFTFGLAPHQVWHP